MSDPIVDLPHLPRSRLRQIQARCGAARLNPLLPQTLAFWALWHCRHARPPDALTARH